MWHRLSLRVRLFLILGSLMIITLVGASVTVWYTYQIGFLFKDVVEKDLEAFETAESLENALVNQKGFVSYYFLDDDPVWLQKLGEYREGFKVQLDKAKRLADTAGNKKTIDEIETTYIDYIQKKDEVIALYKAGERKSGAALHKKVREQFFHILGLCEDFKARHLKRIEDTRVRTQTQAKRLRIIAVTGIWAAIILGGLLGFVLVSQILNPLRGLVLTEDLYKGDADGKNEVKAVSHRVHSLKEHVDETRTELERSKEHLLQSEKLALVGKLAAGMAHSIRNPLTSVKMRLFSLRRTLEVSDTQEEDLDVISEEIRHLDNIVANFLEFSRPPKIKKQKVSPSDVVDMALELLGHRLDSYEAEVTLKRQRRLPAVSIDAEQLKEVLVNLLVNACEATGGTVRIEITEEQAILEPWGNVVRIAVKDDGPGIPEDNLGRVFDPFFSTKEEGTGLGLSIADRILKEHGGNLAVISREGEGTTFTITIPLGEE